MKSRINAGDKNATIAQDDAIAKAYGNKFIIFLDFEMLDSAIPYYQAGLGNCVMKLLSMIMQKLLMHHNRHHPQMLFIRSQTYP